MNSKTKYEVIPGIAACVEVACEIFPERYGRRTNGYIYYRHGVVFDEGSNRVLFDELPQTVQIAIKGHFERQFNLPVKERGKAEPFTVEVHS